METVKEIFEGVEINFVKEIQNFRKIAKRNNISEEEIKRISMKVWKITDCEYSDCF